jgi:dsDNA-specific endonuclease/ATPase MutS2
MLDISSLWIGDPIMSTKSGTKGTFEGIGKDGKVRLKTDGKIKLVSAKHLVRYEEKAIKTIVQNKTKKYREVDNFGDSIDLHIERLNPTIANSNPIHIIDYQVRKCHSFIRATIRSRKLSVVIIHGKGTGQLKTEVLNMIQDYPEIVGTKEINNGGAQELQLLYY